MGAGGSDENKQVILLGLPKSGKTRFLYETYAFTQSEQDASTRGFNYETVDTENGKVGVWDIGGSELMRGYWNYYYQNIKFNGVIYMINSNSEQCLEAFEESISIEIYVE